MIKKRRLLINALVSLLQVVVNGGAYFVLYRFLYDTIGIERVGVWATVLTATSVSHLANLGLTGSTLIFVSRYVAQERPERVSLVIQTSAVSVALVLGVVLAAAYPLLARILPWIIEAGAQIPIALAILPFSVASFWLTSCAQVLLSGIDGFERVDLRNVLTMISLLLYVALAVVLVPGYGLLGLAYAQVLQASLLLVAAWVALKRLAPGLPFLPFRWRGDVFREMFSYNVQFQGMSVAQMLFEPTTRALVAKLGGLDAAGFFEMAHKMVLQIRALIITTHQAVVPTIASLSETAPDLLRDVYRKSCRLIIFLVLPSLPLLVALTPVISELYLGAYEPTFVLYACILLVAWMVNVLSGPAYFANLGTGHLRWNLLGHLITGVLNLVLGLGLGLLFGGVGVAAGFAAALIVGSLATVAAYQKEHGIPTAELVERDSLTLGLLSLLGVTLTLGLYRALDHAVSPAPLGLLMLALYLLVIGRALWVHPMRERLMAWVTTSFVARSRNA